MIITSITRNMTNMRFFDETESEVRRALRTSYALDPGTSREARKDATAILTTWEYAKVCAKKQADREADEKLDGECFRHGRRASVGCVEQVQLIPSD